MVVVEDRRQFGGRERMGSISEYVATLQRAFPGGGEIQEQQSAVEGILGVGAEGLREALFTLHTAGYVTVKPHFEGDTVTFTVSW